MTSRTIIVNHEVKGIPVRRMDFTFNDEIPTFWFDGDPFRTMLLTALSCVFPEGERMFMRAVRHYQNELKDVALQKEVRAFIGQEANHGKEHDNFNRLMANKGLPIADIETFVKRFVSLEERTFSPQRMLAKTCALEHFTAMFSEMVLRRPEILDGIDPQLMPLWLWHAVEESEHKAVAFDVYQDQVGSYWIRISEMMLISVMFSTVTVLHTRTLLRAVGESGNRTVVFGGLRRIFGRRGWLSGMLPYYLDYFRPGFHPSKADDGILRARGLKLLEQYTTLPIMQAS